MPSHLHEALIDLFRHRPELAAALLSASFGVDVPAYQGIRLDSGELTDLAPTEYRADAVVVLTTREVPVLAVVVEVQLRRDANKRRSWPVYLATLHARLRCPSLLLVVCPHRATAAWCAEPIDLGHPGWVLCPLVLGPAQVPVVTDPIEASRLPELAVLSAIAHGGAKQHEKVLEALLAALSSIDDDQAHLYADVVLAALPRAARAHLEALMKSGTYEYQSDFARRYYGEGKAQGTAEGEAKAVLAVLAARGITVPDDIRQRINECTDLEQLETWVRRAATADSIYDVFG